MSKRKSADNLLTIDEAASIIGCGVDKIREYMDHGDLKRLRASNGELRFDKRNVEYRAHIARIVADAPPLSNRQIDLIAVLLRPESELSQSQRVPSESELLRRKEAEERAETLKDLKRKAAALTACHGCGLQPEEHTYQAAYGMGYHEWEPIRG